MGYTVGMPEASDPPSNPAPRERCVLWVSPAGAVPSSLVAALDRRHIQPVIVREAADVMLEFSPPPPSAPPSAPSVPSAHAPIADSLIVIEPDLQPRYSELCTALRRYHPAVRGWTYHPRPGGQGPLLQPMPDLHPTTSADATGRSAHHGTAEIETSTTPQRTVESADDAHTKIPTDPADVPTAGGSAPQPPGNRDLDPAASKRRDRRLPSPSSPAPNGRVRRTPPARQRLAALAVQVPGPAARPTGPLVSEAELAMLLGGEDDLP